MVLGTLIITMKGLIRSSTVVLFHFSAQPVEPEPVVQASFLRNWDHHRAEPWNYLNYYCRNEITTARSMFSFRVRSIQVENALQQVLNVKVIVKVLKVTELSTHGPALI
jgi:hypothetical protein